LSPKKMFTAIYRCSTKILLQIRPYVKDVQTSVVIKSLPTASAASRSVDKFEHDK